MTVRNATAKWEGSLKEGSGHLSLGSGAYDGQYNFTSRFEEGTGTNPEELLGAAYAGCYSMAVSASLGREGFTVNYVNTTAKVHLTKGEAGMEISQIELDVEASIDDIDDDKFQQVAQDTSKGCIIARAIAVSDVKVNATLK